ncbi:MAG: GNAT family N-acetyltransferase [Planctomycetota bacterium]
MISDDAIETERLRVERFTYDDAPFLVRLLNEPAYLRHIGDFGVRDDAGACAYLDRSPFASYAQNGFGLSKVSLRSSGEPIGMCGLIRRPGLDAPDIGFAFLETYQGRGYAFEAARAVLDDARSRLGLERVLAVTALDNERSARLLEKLGLRFERLVTLNPPGTPIRLFAPGGSVE